MVNFFSPLYFSWKEKNLVAECQRPSPISSRVIIHVLVKQFGCLGHVPIWTYHLTSSGKNKPYALYLCKKLARVLTTDIFANYTFTDHDVKKPLKTRQFPARNLIALSICSATALAWTDHVQFQLETRLLLDQLTCQRVSLKSCVKFTLLVTI